MWRPKVSVRVARAFTLVEMMVALVIAVIVLGALYGTFAAATRSAEGLRARTARDRSARLLFARFRGDLACALPRFSDAVEPEEEEDSGRLETERDVAPAFRGGGEGEDVLAVFLALQPPDTRREGPDGLAWIAYRRDRSGRTLLRGSVPAYPGIGGPGEWPDAAWRVVARDVADARAEFFDGSGWGETWDSSEEGHPPHAAALEVAFERDDGERESYRAVVRIAAGGVEPDAPPVRRQGRAAR